MPDSIFKLAHPLARTLMIFVVVVLSFMATTSTTIVRAEIITNSIFVPCATNPAMTVSSFNYNYVTSDNTISISVSGTANEDIQGFNEKTDTHVQLVMQSFSSLESVTTLGAACDLFSKCPNSAGPAIHKGAWSLEMKNISLPKPIPWIDYNITLRMPYESGQGNYLCATIPITQALESYNRLAGQMFAALPPLALFTGLLDTYLSPEYSILTFVMGDGSSFRLPGFFDLWEHAQWVAMTGMLGAYYTRPYEAFVSGFGWSFFNWNIPFIDAIAGESVAQPGLLIPSSSVIGSGNVVATAANSHDTTTTHRLVARQQLPVCSPNNPGPAGVCSDPTQCCSPAGYCGTGPSYCGKGSGPAANSKPSSTTTPSTSSNTGSSGQATVMSDENAMVYSSSRSGLTAYANYMGIATDRFVHVTFYTFIFAMLVYLVVAGIAILAYGQIRNYRGVYSKAWPNLSVVTDGAIGILLRLTILGFLPLLLTAIHHLALPLTSQFGAGGVAIASITVMIILSGPVYLLFLIFTRHSPTALFDSLVYLLRLGPLYNAFIAGRIRYAVVPIFRRVVYAIIIGAGQNSGVAQLACLIVFEIGFVLLEVWLVPRSMAFGNQLAASTGMLRTIGWLFIIPLLKTLSLSEGKRQLVAFVFVLFHLLLLLLWLILIIRSLVCILLRYRSQALFNRPGATNNGRQRPVIRHGIHQHDSNVENGSSEPMAFGTGNLGSPMTVGDFEFIVRDGGDSFDRYHPPTARFSAMPRASVISGAYSATGSTEPSNNSTGTAAAANNSNQRYTPQREGGQTLPIDSTPPTTRPRRQSDADFLRSNIPNTTDAPIAPARGYITDGTGNSSIRSYPDTPDYTGAAGDGYPDDDTQSQGDELFYYGGGEVPSTNDDTGATGAASANQPRLIPAFLRQHDAQDSSGDEMGMQNQTTFPRYMKRAETQNHRA